MRDIDSVITAMYETVCFEPGARPDWSREDAIFAPGARMIRVTDAGVFEFDVASFRSNIESMIDSGELPSFWEGEIWRETHAFGEVAHVLSAYETRRTKNGDVVNRGVNSIQLFQRDGEWRICAMIWRRDGKAIQIPTTPPSPSISPLPRSASPDADRRAGSAPR